MKAIQLLNWEGKKAVHKMTKETSDKFEKNINSLAVYNEVVEINVGLGAPLVMAKEFIGSEIDFEKARFVYYDKLNLDRYGNERIVIHFIEFRVFEDLDVSKKYTATNKLMNKIGGRKYHNNRYGGGIAFTVNCVRALQKEINKVLELDGIEKPIIILSESC